MNSIFLFPKRPGLRALAACLLLPLGAPAAASPGSQPSGGGDMTPPAVLSIDRAGANPTNAAILSWTATFGEPVTGVGMGDFVLMASGVSGAAITGVIGSGATYTINASGGTGGGTLALNLADDDSIMDAAGNPLGGAGAGNGDFAGQAYDIDRTAPAPVIASSAPNPTSVSPIPLAIDFGEAVAGFSVEDLIVGNGSAGPLADLGSGMFSADVTPSASGTVTVDIAPGAASDAAGNPSNAAARFSIAFEGGGLDATPPTAVSINRASPNPSSAPSVSWTATFSEAVFNVDAADFALVAPEILGASITDVSGSGTIYTVTANAGAGNGTLGLNLVDDDSIVDTAGNHLGGTGPGNGDFMGQVYNIANGPDTTPPTVVSLDRADPDPTSASTVSWTATFSESVMNVEMGDFSLASSGISGVSGASVTGLIGSGATYTVMADTGMGNGTLGLNLVDDDSIVDAAGNRLGGTGAGNGDFTGQAYTVRRTAPPDSQLDNISTRGDAGTGDFVMILGFIVDGNEPKRVLITGLGPSLATLGVPGAMDNPVLTLYDSSAQAIAANDNWVESSDASSITLFQQRPGHSLEAAILATLAPGTYTAHLAGFGGTAGQGLVEVWEGNPAQAARLRNVSTRGKVGTGDFVLIAGFVVGGTEPKTVLITGRGPSLEPFGVPEALANPAITLYDSAAQVVATNDNWPSAPNALEIMNSANTPPDVMEAAIYMALPPGTYTVHLRGVGGATGQGLVEVWDENLPNF